MIDNLTFEAKKREFIDLLKSTNRQNIDSVINWLENLTDFFVAPSSTAFHGNFKHGLLCHSMNVYYIAKQIKQGLINESDLHDIPNDALKSISDDNIIIAALLHDICKCNFYKEDVKWKKDADNKWQSYLGYSINDQFPFGHGEKSVLYLQMLNLKMSVDEMLAIRWHMGTWDGGMLQNEAKFAAAEAESKYPLCTIIQCADKLASMCLEIKI